MPTYTRLFHLLLCVLLIGPLSVPGSAVMHPENRVGGSLHFSSTFASELPAQVPDPHRGYQPSNYDQASELHKYLYAQGDPVNGTDPSGEFTITVRGALVTVAVAAVVTTVYVTAIHPYVKSARRTADLNLLQARSDDLTDDDVEVAVDNLRLYWPNNAKIQELVQRLKEGSLHVRVIRRNSTAARHLLSGTQVFVPQEALDEDDGGRALAILIFGEYQHSPVSGDPILDEQEAQLEFEQVRQVLRDLGLSTPYIESYEHGAH